MGNKLNVVGDIRNANALREGPPRPHYNEKKVMM
jgi:hypothetical protein